jgi:WD40 repeat protein
VNYIKGYFFYEYNIKNNNINLNNNNAKDMTPEKYYNIIACGYDTKDNYSITELIYVPVNENKESKEYRVISSDMSLLAEPITCLIIVQPKKIEKKCLICGTKNGKIILFPFPFKDANCKWDEAKTHNDKVNKIVYISEVNMLISSGDDGNIFIYSLYEILGETVLYDKKAENMFQLNTTLDIALGNNVLFPISELEKIEINKNEEKDMEEKFIEEKEKIAFEHKNNISKLIIDMNLKFEEEKKIIKTEIQLLKEQLKK